MKPYIATYPDGTTETLSYAEAVDAITSRRCWNDPTDAHHNGAVARGLLAMLDQGLDGIYLRDAVITLSFRAALQHAVPHLLFVGSLVALAFARFDVAAACAALGAFLLVLLRQRLSD